MSLLGRLRLDPFARDYYFSKRALGPTSLPSTAPKMKKIGCVGWVEGLKDWVLEEENPRQGEGDSFNEILFGKF